MGNYSNFQICGELYSKYLYDARRYLREKRKTIIIIKIIINCEYWYNI